MRSQVSWGTAGRQRTHTVELPAVRIRRSHSRWKDLVPAILGWQVVALDDQAVGGAAPSEESRKAPVHRGGGIRGTIVPGNCRPRIRLEDVPDRMHADVGGVVVVVVVVAMVVVSLTSRELLEMRLRTNPLSGAMRFRPARFLYPPGSPTFLSSFRYVPNLGKYSLPCVLQWALVLKLVSG